MIDLIDVRNYVQDRYNSAISVYHYDSHVRVTNGSASMYADIHVDGETLKIGGQRHNETFQERYPATENELQEALCRHLGL